MRTWLISLTCGLFFKCCDLKKGTTSKDHKINKIMKTIFFSCLFLLAGIAFAQAQIASETLTIKPVKKGEEPKEVMEAIKQDFPKAIVQNLSILPAKLYGEYWSVYRDDNLSGKTPAFYVVYLKETNELYRALYDKHGNIKSSKFIIKQAQLPKEVTSTVAKKYPDWKIINDLEKITSKDGKTKEVYHVGIEKNKMHRSLFLDNSGKLIKDVPRRIL